VQGEALRLLPVLPGRRVCQRRLLGSLARDNAKAIKKYLVKRGIKGRDVSLKTKIYKVGRSSKVEVLVSKTNSS
jgi:hypothetical protein